MATARSLVDQIKAVFVTLAKNFGMRKEPVTQRVENARMSQTRLKALDKPVDKNATGNPRRSIVGIEAAKTDEESAILKINSMASMSHYRLNAYASTMKTERPADHRIEAEIDDDEFIDAKERRARELAAKYC